VKGYLQNILATDKLDRVFAHSQSFFENDKKHLCMYNVERESERNRTKLEK